MRRGNSISSPMTQIHLGAACREIHLAQTVHAHTPYQAVAAARCCLAGGGRRGRGGEARASPGKGRKHQSLALSLLDKCGVAWVGVSRPRKCGDQSPPCCDVTPIPNKDLLLLLPAAWAPLYTAVAGHTCTPLARQDCNQLLCTRRLIVSRSTHREATCLSVLVHPPPCIMCSVYKTCVTVPLRH